MCVCVCVFVCFVSAFVCASWCVLSEKILRYSHIYFESNLILNYQYIIIPYKIIFSGQNLGEWV